MNAVDRPLVWLHGEVRTPPFSGMARAEAGFLLRVLQAGGALGMPHSRPMPEIGSRCAELRIRDVGSDWRIIYRVDPNVVVILEVFAKTTPRTPGPIVDACRRRLRSYDHA
jgi:phage-related protein